MSFERYGLLTRLETWRLVKSPVRRVHPSKTTEQLFQRLDVCGESVATSFRNAIDGLRLAQHELLLDGHVPGFLELEQLGAQVAVRGLGLSAEPSKLSLFHTAEQRKQGQPQPAVNHGIELGQIRHGLNRAFAHLHFGDHAIDAEHDLAEKDSDQKHDDTLRIAAKAGSQRRYPPHDRAC
jgi:hypothetical protein